jgi:hypothetical protein
MYRRTGKIIAIVSLIGCILSAMTLPRWVGHCAASYPEPITSFLVLVFGILMAFSRFPLTTLFVCILWTPIHYIIAIEPCAPARSQGAGGLIYILAYAAVPVVLACSFLLGSLIHYIFPVKNSQKPAEV